MTNPTTAVGTAKAVSGAAISGTGRQPAQDAIDYLKAYARERPEVAALWCLGIGFILGWKLKPW
jgi:hypothetical protein